jgi:hypothetical protein
MVRPFNGELACGSIRNRAKIFDLLIKLPRVVIADNEEVLRPIESKKLHGKGIGLIDVHLIAT